MLTEHPISGRSIIGLIQNFIRHISNWQFVPSLCGSSLAAGRILRSATSEKHMHCIGLKLYISLLLSCLCVLRYQKLESAIHVASNCSLSIAAARRPNFDPNYHWRNREDIESRGTNDMSLLPVKWASIF